VRALAEHQPKSAPKSTKAKLFNRLLQKGRYHLNDVIAHSVQDQFADGMQVELAHGIAAMCLRSFYAEAESDGHLLGTLAFRQKLDDSLLSICQLFLLSARLRIFPRLPPGVDASSVETAATMPRHRRVNPRQAPI
jgi:hypothetical protein